jgi:hypothetical protein
MLDSSFNFIVATLVLDIFNRLFANACWWYLAVWALDFAFLNNVVYQLGTRLSEILVWLLFVSPIESFAVS